MRDIHLYLLTNEQKQSPPKWVEGMDKYSGKEATIIYVVPGSSAMGGQIYILDIDNNGYGWSSIWLTKLGLKLPDKSMQRRPRSGFGVMLSAFRAAR